jgi:hypothetical protein
MKTKEYEWPAREEWARRERTVHPVEAENFGACRKLWKWPRKWLDRIGPSEGNPA